MSLIDTLRRLNVGWSITVRINKTIRAAIGAIDENAWVPIVYPDSGEAAVAETTHVTGRGRKRRSRLTDPAHDFIATRDGERAWANRTYLVDNGTDSTKPPTTPAPHRR